MSSTTLQTDNSYDISVRIFGQDNEFIIEATDNLVMQKQIKDSKLSKPIYLLEFSLPTNVAYTLTKSKDYRILLSVATSKEAIIDYGLGSDDIDSTDVDEKFLYPFSTTELNLDTALEIELDAENDINNPNEFDTHSSRFIIEAFDLNDIKNNLNLINMTLRNVTVEDVILECIKRSGIIIDNVIFSKPDNNIEYDEIFIPPMDFVDSIKYIEDKYGIYKGKMLLFFEDNSLIIKSRDTSVSTVGSDNVIKIFNGTNSLQNINTYYGRETYINPDDSSLLYQEPILVTNNVSEMLKNVGTKFFTNDETDKSIVIQNINYDLLDKSVLSSMENINLPEKRNALINHNRNNRLFFENKKREIYSEMIKSAFSVTYADPKDYKMYKMFSITFFSETQKRYSGIWSPEKIVTSYTREDRDYVSSVDLSLYKVL